MFHTQLYVIGLSGKPTNYEYPRLNAEPARIRVNVYEVMDPLQKCFFPSLAKREGIDLYPPVAQRNKNSFLTARSKRKTYPSKLPARVTGYWGYLRFSTYSIRNLSLHDAVIIILDQLSLNYTL